MKKKKYLWLLAPILPMVLLLLLGRCGPEEAGIPTLTVETPPKANAGEDVIVDVSISALGDASYPAMSLSLSFDPSRLEFLGVNEGNVFLPDSDAGQRLPTWSYDADAANRSGTINIMYLDMTGGKYAFTKVLLTGREDVLMRLCFRVRGSVRDGEVLDVVVEDAVFAASEESQSLASSTASLVTRNGKIVIGG